MKIVEIKYLTKEESIIEIQDYTGFSKEASEKIYEIEEGEEKDFTFSTKNGDNTSVDDLFMDYQEYEDDNDHSSDKEGVLGLYDKYDLENGNILVLNI